MQEESWRDDFMRRVVMKHGKETETTKEKHFPLFTLHTINNGNINALILMINFREVCHSPVMSQPHMAVN